MQTSSRALINAQDDELLVTEFSIIGQTSSSSGSSSTIGDVSISTNDFESRSTASGGVGSTNETGMLLYDHTLTQSQTQIKLINLSIKIIYILSTDNSVILYMRFKIILLTLNDNCIRWIKFIDIRIKTIHYHISIEWK